MNTNSNNNVNAQMIALGRAISNPYAGTSTSNSTNEDDNYINRILKDCLTSMVCEKIMNNGSDKRHFTGMEDLVYRTIRLFSIMKLICILKYLIIIFF